MSLCPPGAGRAGRLASGRWGGGTCPAWPEGRDRAGEGGVAVVMTVALCGALCFPPHCTVGWVLFTPFCREGNRLKSGDMPEVLLFTVQLALRPWFPDCKPSIVSTAHSRQGTIPVPCAWHCSVIHIELVCLVWFLGRNLPPPTSLL